MKNIWKVFGMIALVAMIAFTFAACDNGGGGGGGGGEKCPICGEDPSTHCDVCEQCPCICEGCPICELSWAECADNGYCYCPECSKPWTECTCLCEDCGLPNKDCECECPVCGEIGKHNCICCKTCHLAPWDCECPCEVCNGTSKDTNGKCTTCVDIDEVEIDLMEAKITGFKIAPTGKHHGAVIAFEDRAAFFVSNMTGTNIVFEFTLDEAIDISEDDYFIYQLAADTWVRQNSLQESSIIFKNAAGAAYSVSFSMRANFADNIGATNFEANKPRFYTGKVPYTAKASASGITGEAAVLTAVKEIHFQYQLNSTPVTAATDKLYIRNFSLEKGKDVQNNPALDVTNGTNPAIAFEANGYQAMRTEGTAVKGKWTVDGKAGFFFMDAHTKDQENNGHSVTGNYEIEMMMNESNKFNALPYDYFSVDLLVTSQALFDGLTEYYPRLRRHGQWSGPQFNGTPDLLEAKETAQVGKWFTVKVPISEEAGMDIYRFDTQYQQLQDLRQFIMVFGFSDEYLENPDTDAQLYMSNFVIGPALSAATFSAVSANGSGEIPSVTTTELTLTFLSPGITNLTKNDVIVGAAADGIVKGDPTGGPLVYTLPISGFTSGGIKGIEVVKRGYNITHAVSTIRIHHESDDPYTGPSHGTCEACGVFPCECPAILVKNTTFAGVNEMFDGNATFGTGNAPDNDSTEAYYITRGGESGNAVIEFTMAEDFNASLYDYMILEISADTWDIYNSYAGWYPRLGSKDINVNDDGARFNVNRGGITDGGQAGEYGSRKWGTIRIPISARAGWNPHDGNIGNADALLAVGKLQIELAFRGDVPVNAGDKYYFKKTISFTAIHDPENNLGQDANGQDMAIVDYGTEGGRGNPILQRAPDGQGAFSVHGNNDLTLQLKLSNDGGSDPQYDLTSLDYFEFDITADTWAILNTISLRTGFRIGIFAAGNVADWTESWYDNNFNDIKGAAVYEDQLWFTVRVPLSLEAGGKGFDDDSDQGVKRMKHIKQIRIQVQNAPANFQDKLYFRNLKFGNLE